MRIEALEYALVIAETGSISQAAEIISIQQTTLSAAIRSLERELGYPLFKRTHNGVEVTLLGQQALVIAEQMVTASHEMLALNTQKPSLSIYVNLSIYNVFSNQIYPQLFDAAKNITVNLYHIPPESYWSHRRSAHGIRQVGIDYYPKDKQEQLEKLCQQNGLHAEPLMEMRLMAYINRSNPLSERQRITLAMLQHQRVVLGRYSEALLQDAGMSLRNYTVMEGPDAIQVLNLVNEGDTIAIFPDHKTIPAYNILDRYTEVIPVRIATDIPDALTYVQYLIYLRDMRFTREEKQLLQIIRNQLHD